MSELTVLDFVQMAGEIILAYAPRIWKDRNSQRLLQIVDLYKTIKQVQESCCLIWIF